MNNCCQSISLQANSNHFDIDLHVIMKPNLPDEQFDAVVTVCNELFSILKDNLHKDVIEADGWL